MRRSGAQSLAGPSTWLEDLPIRHQPFYLGEAKCHVGLLGRRIRELRGRSAYKDERRDRVERSYPTDVIKRSGRQF
jgi:hypothetical protein